MSQSKPHGMEIKNSSILLFVLLVLIVSPLRAADSNLTAEVLSEGWRITNVQTNDLGSVAFGGGFVGVPGDLGSAIFGTDSVVLVNHRGFQKVAKIGDAVPGAPDRVFTNLVFTSLNNSDEITFVGYSAPNGEAGNCMAFPVPSGCNSGLYLFSAGRIREVALGGKSAPGTDNLVYAGDFFSSTLNDEGDIAFGVRIGPNRSEPTSDALFLFREGRVTKIVSGLKLTSAVTLDNFGRVTFASAGVVSQFYMPHAVPVRPGEIREILKSGDPLAGGGAVPDFTGLDALSTNRNGDLVVQLRGVNLAQSGLYLIPTNGKVVRILSNGDASPVGGTFSITYQYNRAHSTITDTRNLKPKLDDSGQVVFVAAVTGGSTAKGIFLYSDGQIHILVRDGSVSPNNPNLLIKFEHSFGDIYGSENFAYDVFFGPLGRIYFTAYLLPASANNLGFGLFVLNDRGVSGLATEFPTGGSDIAPGTGGGTFVGIDWPIVTNDVGDVVFLAGVLNSSYKLGIFRASIPAPAVANPDFEAVAPSGLPDHWTTNWVNSGRGEAEQYDSNGIDSYSGDGVLRLHVGPPSGSVFVLSDPIPVLPGEDFLIQCRMRYYLTGSDSVYFTVLQYDSAGHEVDLWQVVGGPGDNYWQWVPEQIMFKAAPTAASIRIRFGLNAATESYLDVDSIGGRDTP
jgi:hypothetical protein